jgi:hypothetical protein
MEKDAPALHRMKYDVGVIIKLIIHQFEQVAGTIETKSDVFVFVRFHGTVILVVLKGVAYVFSADTVPERRRDAFDDDFHTSTIPHIR